MGSHPQFGEADSRPGSKTQAHTGKGCYSEKYKLRALEQITGDRTNLDWAVWGETTEMR